MKILFDASILGYSLLKDQYRTGIYQVALSLLRNLSALPGLEVLVYSSSGNTLLVRRVLDREGLNQLSIAGSGFFGTLYFGLVLARNLCYRRLSVSLARGLGNVLARFEGLRLTVDRRVLTSASWYFSPMEAPPESIRRIPQLGIAVLIHDLIPLVLKGYAQNPQDPTRWFSRTIRSLRPTDLLFTVSQFTKEEFLRLFPHFFEKRIVAAPNAVDKNRFFPLSQTRPTEPSFFLTVSTVEPRKRIDTIMEAFQKYRRLGGQAELVVCGANRQGYLSRVLDLLPVQDRPFVRFTGYLHDEELPPLYQACLAFVYVSEYEGFGLPVLEAMTCGAPVIVSDRTSLPEVVGEAGMIVPADDAEGLSRLFSRLELEPSLRDSQRQKSLLRAQDFSWKSTAAIIETSLRGLSKETLGGS